MTAKKLTDYERTRGYWFRGVTFDEECMNNIKRNITGAKKYFYIIHQADKVDEEETTQEEISATSRNHLHFLCCFNGGRNIKQVSDFLELPSNFIQRVRDPRTTQRYLIHKDSPDKIQYDISDVVTNSFQSLELAIQDNQDISIDRLFQDLDALARGEISKQDWLGLHKFEALTLPFFQKISLYRNLNEISSDNLYKENFALACRVAELERKLNRVSAAGAYLPYAHAAPRTEKKPIKIRDIIAERTQNEYQR